MDFQRSSWRVERVAWVVFVAIAAASLLGLFGRGPLSATTAAAPSGALHVSYDRFQRLSAPSAMHVKVSAATQDGRVTLDLGGDFLRAFTLEHARPEPVAAIATDDGLRLTFAAAPGEPAEIRLLVAPQAVGASRSRLRLTEGVAVALEVFTFP